MKALSEAEQYLSQWLAQCFTHSAIELQHITKIKHSAGREVWDCVLTQETIRQGVIVTIFKPSLPDNSNRSLSAVETAQKCAWAMQVFPTIEIPTPSVYGIVVQDEVAALVVAKIERSPWQSETRMMAAQCLARLHTTSLQRLPLTLQQLIRSSDPKLQRTRLWLASRVAKADRYFPAWREIHPVLANAVQAIMTTDLPVVQTPTIVHADYFSANIIPTATSICVIDWETLALGDPMWDLAFLLGADRNLAQQEVETALAAYAVLAPLDRQRFMWYKQWWDSGWQLGVVIQSFAARNIQ